MSAKAIRELETIITTPHAPGRRALFDSWLDRWVATLAVRQTLAGEIVRTVGNRDGLEAAVLQVQTARLAAELLAADGVVHRHSTTKLVEDVEERIAFLTVLRQEPKREEPEPVAAVEPTPEPKDPLDPFPPPEEPELTA